MILAAIYVIGFLTSITIQITQAKKQYPYKDLNNLIYWYVDVFEALFWWVNLTIWIVGWVVIKFYEWRG